MNIIIFLFIILTLLGLVFQKSKLLTIIVFLFVWTLAWCTNLPDYYNYENAYEIDFFSDPGYMLVSFFFKKWGFDYFDFRLCFIGFGLFCYLFFILKFAKRCSLVACLYLCTLSFYDIVQNRSFVAFGISLIGMYFLISKKSVFGKILYVGLVLLASTIHISISFYLIFLFADKKILARIPKIVLIVVALIFVIVLQYMFSSQYALMVERYDVGVSTLTKSLLVVLFVSNLVFIKIWNSNKGDSWLSTLQSQYVRNKGELVLYFNIALLLVLPAAFMSLNAMRLYRYMGVVNYTFVTNKFRNSCMLNTLRLTLIIVLYAVSYGIISYLMHSTSFFEIVDPILYENLFYKF